jgi:hypothetical protein
MFWKQMLVMRQLKAFSNNATIHWLHGNTNMKTKLNLIVNQIQNMLASDPKRHRYCNDTLLMAFIVLNVSKAASNCSQIATIVKRTQFNGQRLVFQALPLTIESLRANCEFAD